MTQTKTDQILEANKDLLLLSLSNRRLNPHTEGLPLTLDEAWTLVVLGLQDIPQGNLMTWGGISDCLDHETDEEECLHWVGAMEARDYESKAGLGVDGPFEWWATPKEVVK